MSFRNLIYSCALLFMTGCEACTYIDTSTVGPPPDEDTGEVVSPTVDPMEDMAGEWGSDSQRGIWMNVFEEDNIWKVDGEIDIENPNNEEPYTFDGTLALEDEDEDTYRFEITDPQQWADVMICEILEEDSDAMRCVSEDGWNTWIFHHN